MTFYQSGERLSKLLNRRWKQRRRGKDGAGVKRKRRCKRCVAWGEVEWRACPGSTNKGMDACMYFDGDPPMDDEDELGEEEGDEGEDVGQEE